MKSYTDIEQSKVLAKILPIKSADMAYSWAVIDKEYSTTPYCRKLIDDELPCWSLAALLDILSYPTIGKRECGWQCASFGTNKDGKAYLGGRTYNNPIDACYEMILRLHELEML